MPSLGLNASASFSLGGTGTVGGGAPGGRSDPYAAFSFLVEVEGLIVGGFTEVRGLEVETEVNDYREGGLNEYVHRLPGPTKYPSNLVLKHGLTDIDALWGWHQEVCQGRIERRNGSVVLLDCQRNPVIWWDFKEAYPVKWSGPELKADTNAVAVESIELVHHGLSKSVASGVSASAAAEMTAGISISFGGSIGF